MNQEAIEFAQIRAQTIKDLLPQLNEPGSTLLDFGCGDGLLTNYLQLVFFQAEVIGADQSPHAIAQARENFPEITFNAINSKQLPFADNMFNAAIVSLVLHHITRAEHKQWINELMRILKPHGYLIIQELNPFNLLAYRRFKRDPKEKGLQMISPFYVNKLLSNFDLSRPWYKCLTITSMYTVIGQKE
jgi:ubiquinone/menaquinone biosynthesis C-methylase UbiE